MLEVAARWGDCVLDLVVGHAPCNARHSADNPNSENREWWRSLELTAPKLASCGCWTPMARLGRMSATRSAVLRENDSGLMLREALMEFDMFLLATYGKCVGGETDLWTWTLSVGTTHRLDCVVLSEFSVAMAFVLLSNGLWTLLRCDPTSSSGLRLHLGSWRRWQVARSTVWVRSECGPI